MSETYAMNNLFSGNSSSLLDYNTQVLENFHSLCQPLFQCFPITHFFYGRFFNDGHYFLLSHDLKVLDCLVNYMNVYDNCFFEKFRPIREEEVQKYIWPREYENTLPILKILHSLGIGHGLNVVSRRREDKSIENFVFATHLTSQNVYNIYLNHFPLLNRFIFYFKKNASKIIENPCTKRLAYSPFYQSEMKKLENMQHFETEKSFSSFIRHTRVRRYDVKGVQNRKVFLSERQVECLYQLTKGRTTKEIAQKLGISYRTVQTHLNIVKEKVGSHSRSSALGCLSEEIINFLETGMRKISTVHWEI